ncbi:BEM_collapsed_G0045450.mRNA.1.CDS.1 [Saccharomyces cerevisiae]|nr:BEM_collapsed_G0045450.mRNA.1.CDS.1 [Saccharomyces cerevisiae]
MVRANFEGCLSNINTERIATKTIKVHKTIAPYKTFVATTSISVQMVYEATPFDPITVKPSDKRRNAYFYDADVGNLHMRRSPDEAA